LITGNNSFFEKAFHPSVLRFCFMQAHYRSVLDISNEAMLASEKGFNRLMEAVKSLDNLEASATSSINVEELKTKVVDALLDDFNSPIVIANLFEIVKTIFAIKDKKETISQTDLDTLKQFVHDIVFEVLGLQNVEENNSEKLDQALKVLIDLRNQARKAKNFDLSDQIRDQLLEQGIELKDSRDGTSYQLL